MDAWSLYSLMKRSRRFEEAVTKLWNDGLISGEMHLGTGEEAIIAGIVSQLGEGDAMAVDHRGSAAFLLRGVDPVLLLRELLGREDGLCCGQGGHMHLFSKEHLSAASGIVGAAGPSAVGFALAAQTLRPGSLAVAFFGEGAMNQGMLMESINLAALWSLPVLFVCKDDGWAITTTPAESSSGSMEQKVRGLGAQYVHVDGLEVGEVWEAAHQAMERARLGKGPTFLHADCVHLDGHFLGFTLLRALRNPMKELPGLLGPLMGSFIRPGGGSLPERLAGMRYILSSSMAPLSDPRRDANNDPLVRAERALKSDPERLQELDERIEAEVSAAVAAALQEAA
jgi:acetoin:2,6-dichlorophenolindophenol oxidoreductase subunit alpha